MVLPEPNKARARVHMGAPVLGVQDSGFAFGYRFTNVMGLFENRMNNLQPWEVTQLVGLPIAAGQVQGTPVAGQTITAVVAGVPITYTVQASDVTGGTAQMSVVQNLANAININATMVAGGYTASAQPAVSYPVTAIGATNPFWQLAVVNNLGTVFTFGLSSTGTLYSVPTSQGVAPRPFYTFTDDNYTATGYLAICDYLESKTGSASDLSSKFTKADVVEFRRDELSARDDNYTYWRQRLADFFGIPLYPMQPVGNFGGSGTGLTI